MGAGFSWLSTAFAGGVVAVCLSGAACVRDSRDMQASRITPARWPSGISTRSWGLCSLIGPGNRNPGVWGTDLGFSAHAHADKNLTLLFGDTWASPVDGCEYPVRPSDDLQATLPLQRPAAFKPGAPSSRAEREVQSCGLLEYKHERSDDVTSWQRVRLFPNANAHRDDVALDMSGLRTPLAAFSDGERLLGLFQRNDPVYCSRHAECPTAMECSSDPAYHGLPLGECTRLVELAPDAAPDYCRDKHDCLPGADCDPVKRGVCLATKPFDADTPEGLVAAPWYREDPKRGVTSLVYVAAAIWPDRPADYVTLARFPTNRFQNVAARSVAYFDPQHPENNDYRPGYHTLLLWGRNSFVERDGAQSLPFLLYVPLDELRGEPEKAVWRPRFFAGFGDDGNPAWSLNESDARPIYGDQARLQQPGGDALQWSEPEFDLVAQMSLSWVEPLSRWVMFYGGDLPAFMVLEPRTGKARQPVNLQFAPGAIHMRTAPHPWGRAHDVPTPRNRANVVPARRGDAVAERAPVREHMAGPGWSSAEPVLTRQLAAPYLACGSAGPDSLPGCVPDTERFRPFAVLAALASGAAEASRSEFSDAASSCIGGALARKAQDVLSGDMIGRLYAPEIIDDWTQDVTDDTNRARGERSAEVYWNVSTWNPYQVALFKTQLTAPADDAHTARN